ncbi:sialate O-acetylesterase [Pontiella sp.]|uniref:sialate O-acetylesterase n=1 Tax=Pontiella sp. TaxID=2837462 RepID=UPI0035657D65
MKKVRAVIFLVASLFVSAAMGQSLKLASLFSSDMVLQQQTDAAIWGQAAPGAKVSVAVSWSKQVAEATADADGRWKTSIKTPKAGGPHRVTVKSGGETVELKNVLSGEVWFCTGQSNMQWKMRGYGVDFWKEDVEAANLPNIRFCQVAQVIALEPQDSVQAKWSVCNPTSVLSFSAIGFFFGRELYEELNVPIGLVSVNWGGSSAETWVAKETLSKQFPEFNARMAEYPKMAAESGVLHMSAQGRPQGLNQRNPAVLYNGMINPLVSFALRGAIWYQGESNVKDPVQYRTLFPAMIQDWRTRWGIGDFPFYYVQIAPFNYKSEPIPVAFLREAQTMALSVPNTGMAVTMDVGDETNIHPKQKKPVAHRLALLALAKTYGKSDLVYSGPLYKACKVEGNQIRLAFDHVDGGLVGNDGEALTHFTISGADRKFVDAEAVIDGDTVVVRAAGVSKPVAVRYGWGNADMPNLANQEGLPAPSFRTDDWPVGNK